MSIAENSLTAAVDQVTSAATLALKVSSDPEVIRLSTVQLRLLMSEWSRADTVVRKTLSTFLEIARSLCDHRGAVRGSNDRDGDWMNPCPTCGATK